MVAKLSCGELNDKERNRKIKQAEIEEILLCFAMLCGLMPIMKEEIKGHHCTYLPPTEKQIMDEGVSLMLGEVDFIDYWWTFF